MTATQTLSLIPTLLGALVVGLAGPSPVDEDVVEHAVEQHVDRWEAIRTAVAVIHPTEGNQVSGTVWFTDTDDGVRVQADISGLYPGSKHGFHIHRFGDGTARDATSAGGHYDPEGTNHHARPNAPTPHHAGDLGNLQADASGHAQYDCVIHGITVAGMTDAIIGRGVIIHAEADQFDQPTGSAGARIGFGCIGVANPKDEPKVAQGMR